MKPLSTEEINNILDRYTEWLSYPNIVSIDVIAVQSNENDVSYELVVEQLATTKISENLSEDNATFKVEENMLEIPKQVTIGEDEKSVSLQSVNRERVTIPTNVMTVDEIFEDELLTNLEEGEEEVSNAVRPCPGGYLIKTSGLSGAGSLCTSISYCGGYRILSNNHVISKNGSIGQWVFQPTIETTGNRLKTVSGFVPIKYYASSSQQNPSFNTNDIAWCDSDPSTSSQEVRGIGAISGWRPPVVGEKIKVFGGKTASLKTAKIKSVTKRYRSNGTLGYSWWKNGIQLDALITQSGDSGSAYVASSDNKLVAIHRAGLTSGSTGAPL